MSYEAYIIAGLALTFYFDLEIFWKNDADKKANNNCKRDPGKYLAEFVFISRLAVTDWESKICIK